jgi:hypothetical protein
MVKTKPKTVDEILSRLDVNKKRIVDQTRSFVKSVVPNSLESVRRGRIIYKMDGKDFAGIRLTKQHVDLLFFQGTSLSSPELKGKGTPEDPKHLQIGSWKNFEDNETKRLLKEASTII